MCTRRQLKLLLALISDCPRQPPCSTTKPCDDGSTLLMRLEICKHHPDRNIRHIHSETAGCLLLGVPVGRNAVIEVAGVVHGYAAVREVRASWHHQADDAHAKYRPHYLDAPRHHWWFSASASPPVVESSGIALHLGSFCQRVGLMRSIGIGAKGRAESSATKSKYGADLGSVTLIWKVRIDDVNLLMDLFARRHESLQQQQKCKGLSALA